MHRPSDAQRVGDEWMSSIAQTLEYAQILVDAQRFEIQKYREMF
jgi:hypothetical protein